MRDEVKLVLPTSWKPDLKDFLSALGVTNGGLGEQLFGPVYDAYSSCYTFLPCKS